MYHVLVLGPGSDGAVLIVIISQIIVSYLVSGNMEQSDNFSEIVNYSIPVGEDIVNSFINPHLHVQTSVFVMI